MRLVAASLTLLLAGVGVCASDRMLYEVEGDQLVFTNVPSHSARPVPGFEPPIVIGEVDLPSSIYDPFIRSLGKDYGLAPELIKAVALVESGLDPHAVSSKGAMGLMQLMPATARLHGVDDPFDPFQSLRGGAAHLRLMLDGFGGNLTYALAAYNAGENAVRRANGVPDYPETREYVRKVQAKLRGRSRPARGGAEASPPPSPAAADVSIRRLPDGSVLLAN